MTRYVKIAKAVGSYAAQTLPPLVAAEAWRNGGLTFWAGMSACVAIAAIPEALHAMQVFASIH